MDDNNKNTLAKWKEILKLYLDATQVMDELPDLFDLNSAARTNVMAKHDMPHEAVSIMIKHLEEMPGYAFNQFLKAIKKQHEWLFKLISGNDTQREEALVNYEYQKYVSKFLTIFMGNITNGIDALDICMELKAREIITEEQNERIEAVTNNRGNIEGVKILLRILVRRDTKWLKDFKGILRQKNYSADLLQILDDLPDELEEFTCSIECDEKQETSDEFVTQNGKLGAENSSLQNTIATQAGRSYFFSSHVRSDELHGMVDNTSAYTISPDLRQPPLYSEPSPYTEPFPYTQAESGSTYCKSPLTMTPKASYCIHASRIIPKEASMRFPSIKKRTPVFGEDSLEPEQAGLSSKSISGENVIIYGSDLANRTRLAIHIIKSKYPSILDSNGRKIAFIVPKIKEDHKIMQQCFASSEWAVSIHGRTNETLQEIMQTSQVIMIKADVLKTALVEASDTYHITQFDMLIIDECDTVYWNKSLKYIMLEYLKAKQQINSIHLPQVLGLCDNLGYSNMRKQDTAEKYIWTLCALLDAVGGINMVPATTAAQPSIPTHQSTSQFKKENTSSKSNQTHDSFTLYLHVTIDKIINFLFSPMNMRNISLKKPDKICKGSDEYIQWCNYLSTKATNITDTSLSTILKCFSFYLTTYNKALSISRVCHPEDTLKFLKLNFASSPEYTHTSSVQVKRLRTISEDVVARLQKFAQDPKNKNVNLIRIEKEITTNFSKNKNAKLLLVVNCIEMMSHLQSWLNEAQTLKRFSVNAKCISGEGSPSQKKTILNDFKCARTKILVCRNSDISQISEPHVVIIYYPCDTSTSTSKTNQKKGSISSKAHTSQTVLPSVEVSIPKLVVMENAVKVVEKIRQQNKRAFNKNLIEKQQELIQRNGQIASQNGSTANSKTVSGLSKNE